MRTEACPICTGPSEAVLSLDLGSKPPLSSRVSIYKCERCAFAFVASCNPRDYEAYYASVTNDEWHREVEGPNSPSAEQATLLHRWLGSLPPRVLDFGCGSGDLLAEMARAHPETRFFGCDVSSPALATARDRLSGLPNASLVPFERLGSDGAFNLVIVSHVLEHLLDFNVLASLRDLLADDGLLYVEVPDSLRYEHRPRREYLYYFDRLHVNHFTPQALAATAAPFGLALTDQVERDFRYRDGLPYPAFGALFRKGAPKAAVRSPDLRASLERYIAGERRRFGAFTRWLGEFPGVLVWGAGDNFHRAASDGGPLHGVSNMRLLDRRQFRVSVGGVDYETEPPEQTIRDCKWPVVITVSEHHEAIRRQVVEIDPFRGTYLV